MPEISRLTRPKPTTATIDLGEGDSVTLEFDANRVTPRWMNDTQEGVADTDLLVLAKSLERVLTGWDVTNEGAPFPPTADNISNLSFPVVNQLFEAVCSAAAPGEAEGNASSPSVSGPASALSQESPTSLNGSDSSTLPTASESVVLR